MVAFAVGNAGLSRNPIGLAAGVAFGSPVLSCNPTGLAAASTFGGVSLVTPTGITTAAAFGTVPLITPAGFAAAATTNPAPLITPAGYEAGTAFGTPDVVLNTPTLSITATGYAAGADFGSISLITPAGASISSAFGEVPIVIPRGHEVVAPIRVGYVGTGDRAAGDNVSITPPLPRNWEPGHLLIAAVLYSSAAGTVATPIDWTLNHAFGDANGTLYQYSRVAQAGDVAPTFVPSGGSAGDGLVGGIIALKNYSAIGNSAETVNAVAEDILVTAPDATGAINGAVIFIGARNAGFVNAATLSGDGVTWTEAWDFSNGLQGTYLVADVGVWSDAVTLTDKTFDLAGNTATSYGLSIIVLSGVSRPTLTVGASTITPSGYAAPADFGTVPLITPAGHPSPVSAGTVPLITPSGYAATTAIDGVPLVVPEGYGASAAFGNISAVVPVGLSVNADFGNTDIVIPSGYDAPAAFGTPTVIVSAAAGTIAPTGFSCPIEVDGAPVAIPHGFAAAAAFGTPTITLSSPVVTTAVTPTTLSGQGLARARKHLDDLVEAWERIQKRRRKLEVEQERLSRAKTASKRARRATVVDLEAERRIDDAIVACNHAYIMLQEEADQVYAGARSALASFSYDIEAISTENRRALQHIEADYQAMLQADDEDAILALM